MQYHCQEYCDLVSTNNVDDCKKLKLHKEDWDKYCCLLEGERNGQRMKVCNALSQDDYDDVDEYIDKLESRGEASDLEVDCSSNYIIISLLLSLLAFL